MLLVSVIINCHNGAVYLEECLQSIASQTYRNWEIIFVDNASTDDTARIAKKFSGNLKYYKENVLLPLYEARNIAVDKANGTYVAFLDSDDCWMPTKLERQVELANLGCNIIYSRFLYIDDKSSIIKKKVPKFRTGKIHNWFFIRNPVSISNIMVRTEILRENPFNGNYNLIGDFDLWVRLSQYHEFCGVDLPLGRQRLHENNTSKLHREKWIEERRKFYIMYLDRMHVFKSPLIFIYIVKVELSRIFGILRR